ncbi:short chain dehydrogenase/reductase family protein-like protein [Macroventuria anomochaeta]|uniref:Short chain dehydrogenase/reductase family protein-like protein n=1 Tax=Macroventuria anomochaeta TaxID=301207 RepID=A0ACB6SJT6_9PLEO|nr:short chain dehydrogenase/reductase family protein-like protein [Macroventuria anomochaeta]KAF2633547.1 short chain dehydrogenase/reductase family protein-like protein [Macroventuria anomochaeta]
MSNAPASAAKPPRPRSPHFPPHNAPRVWFITRGVSPIAIALAKQVLEHGDYVVAGVIPVEFEKSEGQTDDFKAFLEEVKNTERWRERLRVVGLDAKIVGQCQAAVAEAVEAFGRIDVLLCTASEAVIGTVEELAQSSRTISLVDEIFEINFFANVNIIKAILPVMRERKNGHMIVITGITGHLGTPGLGMYCSSQWAIEGYCDSLAYEIAPFNVKMSIVQANMEVNVLTNRITSVPPMQEYLQEENPAPLAREIFSGLLDRLDGIENPRAVEDPTSPTYSTSTMSPDATMAESTIGDLLSADTVTSLYASLPSALKSSLIAETVHALTAIGGHDNPPARHIVGSEGVTAVKEKLMTTSEELEDFIEVSNAVDITKDYQSVEPSAFD